MFYEGSGLKRGPYRCTGTAEPLQDAMSLGTVDRTVLPFPALKEELVGCGNGIERGDIVADRSPRPLVQNDATASHAALVNTTAPFEQGPGDSDFADDVAVAGKDLADRPGEEFGDAKSDVRPDDQKHAIAEAAVRQEVRFKREKFGGSEWASRHTAKIRSRKITCDSTAG